MIRCAIAMCAAVAAIPSAALACEGAHGARSAMTKAARPLKELSVQELVALRAAGGVKVFDANSAETRARYGIIPGAAMLSSATRFDPSKELPRDKGAKLVFYCASTRCTASTFAAQRALEAGYSDVSVMPAGIVGWKEAGQSTGASSSNI
jgi:rhodanese-related sulfurtransferase